MFGLSKSNENALNNNDSSLGKLLQVIEKVISKHEELKLLPKETNFSKNAYFVSLLLGRFISTPPFVTTGSYSFFVTFPRSISSCHYAKIWPTNLAHTLLLMIGYGFGSSLMQGRVPGRRPNPLFYSIHNGPKISKPFFLTSILPKYECKNLPNFCPSL